MKKMLGILAFLCLISFAQADLIGWSCDDDGDGAIVMGEGTWTDLGGAEYQLEVPCVQNWFPGHLEGDFTADSPDDPTVWIIETVDNYTDFAWTDYHIYIGMTKSFTIGSSVINPSGWTFSITQPTTGDQALPWGGTGWLGVINYDIGTGLPIGIEDSGDFGFKVSFLGSVAFCTEQIPTPEPATMAFLGLGALAILRKK